ncbi:hypothetical protein CAC42_6227 [Sphaceloma murrayae]|uniref:C2H2-type domain-containing protein n=1 Tax=Sphaceloma murrayae TaxID=2082308 RepID=A0A2K1QTX8_9PEZI|nr:hypothetical protein CAC42_6227 [Sphaceloma murrayae]
MASNYNWNGGYGNKQQSTGASHGFTESSANTGSQYGASSTSTYQNNNSYQQQPLTQSSSTSTSNYQDRPWDYQPSQNESRAAETLSALSSQEPTAYSSTQGMNTGSGYGTGAWDPTQQRTSSTSTAPRVDSSTQPYDAAYTSRTAQPGYSTTTNTQSNVYGHDNAYVPGTQRNNAYQHPSTTPNFSSVNAHSSRSRSVTSQSDYQTQAQVANLLPQQSGRASPAVVQTQHPTGHNSQRPITSGHSRVHSVTPNQLQQQARNAPQPHAPQPQPSQTAMGTIDPTQVYDPWPEQKRAAERAAEERKRREVEQAKQKAVADAAEREQKLKEEIALRERQKGIEQAKQLTASALDAASAAGGSDSTSRADAMEAEMRAMFSKMRHFNAANPRLLAKLWEEERQAHQTKSRTQTEATPAPYRDEQPASVTTQSPTTPAAMTSKKSAVKANSSSKVAKPSKSKKEQAAKTVTSPPAPQVSSAPVPISEPSAATHTVTSPTPSSQTATQSIWPPGRKQLLAETGARWLNARPENVGKHIQTERLAQLLNGNPSYPNLCASIEQMGFSLDRSAFARTLLTAVPDLNKSTPAATAPAASASASLTAPPATFGAQVASTSQQSSTQGHQGSVPEAPMVNGVYRPYEPASTPAPQAKRPPIPSEYQNKFSNLGRPLTKEENARKRAFEELATITNEDDSDDDIPPPPKVQNTGQHGYHTGTTMPTAISYPDQPGVQLPSSPQQAAYQTKTADLHKAQLKDVMLVEPIRREKAARRSTYDPRSIARDILLATGRHSEMRPLNGHLMNMQGLLASHSCAVEQHKYDLETIRWDLIDPGEPIADSEDERSNDGGSQADDESDSVSTSALARPTFGGPRTTDHGDGVMTMAMLMHEPVHSLKGLGKIKKRGRPPRMSSHAGMQVFSSNGADNTGLGSGQGTPSGRRTVTTGRPTTTPSSAPQQSVAGRAGSGTPSGNPSGYAAFRAQQTTVDENGHPIKRRGRPVGWRKAIHSKEAQGLTGSSGSSCQRPKSNVSSEMRKRGRPPLDKPAADEDTPPDPNYNVYKCRWEDCGAELHNIDTLRKHILKIHGSKKTALPCLWGQCGLSGPTDVKGKEVAPGRHEFSDIYKWMNHIEENHIRLLLRKLGDGPRAGLSDAYDSETSQAYLSDASGRIITPRATPLADVMEEDEAQSEVLAPILRRGMPRVRGRLSEDQREDETKLQQLEAKKLILGPAFDKGGATLATVKRRKGLYDDEDFEGETDADDGPDVGQSS